MSEIETGGRAFPWCGDLNDMPSINLGMTLRDWFAGQALAGTLPGAMLNPDEYAVLAYRMADSMLRARGDA